MFRLPEGWTTPEAVEDTIETDGVTVHRAGVSALSPSGEEICGSAADRSENASSRAWFELVERVCALDALATPAARYAVRGERGDALGDLAYADVFPASDDPERWVYARSNGIAFHTDWASACLRARWELAERDRIYRSWLGDVAPQPLPLARADLPTRRYEWHAYAFPATEGSFSEDVAVAGVFGFPLEPDLPLATGYAGRSNLAEAVAAATGEAVQLLAFLWGEPPPAEAPRGRPSAMLHLDNLQYPAHHAHIRHWLAGGHSAFRKPRTASGSRDVRFVDLSAAWLPSGARVAKAVCAEALPLTFGDSPAGRHLPAELRIHPIP